MDTFFGARLEFIISPLYSTEWNVSSHGQSPAAVSPVIAGTDLKLGYIEGKGKVSFMTVAYLAVSLTERYSFGPLFPRVDLRVEPPLPNRMLDLKS